MNTIYISSADYLEAYKIRLAFSDGFIREVDFLPFLKKFNHPDYDQYLNEEQFKKFRLINGNVNWNDYHMIFTLESLYKGVI